MQSRPAYVRTGPFLLQPRVVLVGSGLVAIAMGLVHLIDELQTTEVGPAFAVVAVILSQLWLFSLFFAWRGNRLAIVMAGLFAFAEFSRQASTHFAIGVTAIEFETPGRGLGYPITLEVLEVACVIGFVAAIVAISNPRGVGRNLAAFPFLLVALAGSFCLLLHSADDIVGKSFGRLSVEDGLMFAVIAASLWIIGALWMAGSRLLGALFVLLASAYVVISFATLHLARGGVGLDQIDKQNGVGAAVLAGAMTVLAAASLIGSLVWLGSRLMPKARQFLATRSQRRAEARTSRSR
jgi:hypothetical protein